MVHSCCAYGCSQRASKDSKLSFHIFPKNEILRKKWILATKRKNFNPGNNSRICGNHFKEDDYVQHFGQRRLKDGVVPTIFDFPSHLIKPLPKERRTIKRIISSSPQLATENKNCSIENTSSTDTHELTFLENNPSTSSDFPNINNKSVAKPLSKSASFKRNIRNSLYFGDYKLQNLKTEEAKKVWRAAQQQIQKQQSTIKYLRNKQYRMVKKITSLQDLIIHLKNTKKVSDDCYSMLEECIPKSQKQILLKQLKLNTERKYPEELRTFVLTLNFYSSSAYNYVRTMFGKCLPHPKTILKWYQSVDCSPGYTKESLRAIELKVQEMKKNNKPLVCSLIMDEMAARRHTHWSGTRQIGYVNYGFNVESDTLPEAKEALVFLLVAVNSRWKLPIAYFFIDGIKASEKATLVNGCLSSLSNIGVIVTSITFDGAATNLSMATVLGADFTDIFNLKTYFVHPMSKTPIYIILDPCHMIKLIRNLLGDWGAIYDKNNTLISWDFFKSLVNFQEKNQLHAATKIRLRHINYHQEKMKVKLAVQTFSESVADALLYLGEDLKLPQFQGAEATAYFCQIMNNLFDILNTRNSLSKNVYKKALSEYNIEFIKSYFDQCREYLYGLKNLEGVNIFSSRRKTGIIGLLVDMKSIEGIVQNHILENKHLNYLLSYKLSQDHLEMFFSNIRTRGGFNNNPTCVQFEAAYKKLLIHVELKSSEAANCLAQDTTSILKVTSSYKNTSAELDLLHSGAEYSKEITDTPYTFSKYSSDVVEYIAGYVSRKLIKSFNCEVCCRALTQQSLFSALLERKNRGGLRKPSNDVIKICKIAETVFRCYEGFSSNSIINKLIILGVRQLNFRNTFLDLSSHILDQDPLNNHLHQLVYNIFKAYFNIRLHHRNKSVNEIKGRIRHVCSKLIHFKNQ